WSGVRGAVDTGGSLAASHSPKGPACVTILTSHMHKRGVLFTTDLIDAAGNTHELYANTVYSDPPARSYTPPMLVNPGERIEYHCTHDNATNPKLACEEQPAVTPGQSLFSPILNDAH